MSKRFFDETYKEMAVDLSYEKDKISSPLGLEVQLLNPIKINNGNINAF